MKRKLFLIAVALLAFVSSALAQNRDVTGKVVDANGEPLIGVSVLVKGTTIGIMTDANGNFALSVPDDAVLEVSSIGFVSQEITVGGRSSFNIVLEEDREMLEETVVIGYGAVKRANFTGSVATYNVGEGPVSNTTRSNALEMLRGMAPGLQMSQSGLAGASPTMRIRGQKSISGGGEPLIVLDGVIFKGSMMDIDPSSIESMSVMKDATSLAAYGSQAANGVIMITSKKGQRGKPMINFRGSVALNEPNYTPDLYDGYEYIDFINAKNGNPQGTTSWLSDLERANYEKGKQTDWHDFVSQTGVRQDYSLNVSGASDGMNYLFGVGYSDNTNFIKGNRFIRETVTGRFNTRVNDYMSVGMNFNWADTRDDGVRPQYNRYFSPWAEPYLEDGVTLRKFIVGGSQESAMNPLWNVEMGRDRENRSNSATLGGNIDIKIPWLEGLSYKITGNYTVRNNVLRDFTYEKNAIQLADTEYTTTTFDKYLSRANGSIADTKSTSWVLDNILTYDRTFRDHYVNATLVYTRDYDKTDAHEVTGTGFTGLGNTSLGVYGLNNADTQQISDITYNLHTDVGYLARANYSFKNKYHFNASVRRDGSSVFGADKKWGTFPAFGFAWTISDEPFFKNRLTAIDYLKLKASWGKNGNQSLQPLWNPFQNAHGYGWRTIGVLW